MISRRQLVQTLIDAGYRRTSNAFGHVARVDREDWQEWMARKHAPWDPEGEGAGWVSSGLRDGSSADFYRRIYSRDKKVLPRELARRIPSSNHDPVGFVPCKLTP